MLLSLFWFVCCFVFFGGGGGRDASFKVSSHCREIRTWSIWGEGAVGCLLPFAAPNLLLGLEVMQVSTYSSVGVRLYIAWGFGGVRLVLFLFVCSYNIYKYVFFVLKLYFPCSRIVLDIHILSYFKYFPVVIIYILLDYNVCYRC